MIERFEAWHLIGEAARLGEAGKEHLAAGLLQMAAQWMGSGSIYTGDRGGNDLSRFANTVLSNCCPDCGMHPRGASHFSTCPSLVREAVKS